MAKVTEKKPERTLTQERLSQILDMKGISARALSLSVGSNDSLVKDIVGGRVANPRLSTLARLEIALGVPTGFLSGSDEDPARIGTIITPDSFLAYVYGDREMAQAIYDQLQEGDLSTVDEPWRQLLEDRAPNLRPVLGVVGAGDAVIALPDGEPIDDIEVPFDAPRSAIGLEVRGDSGLPDIEDHDVAIYDPAAPFALHNCLNRRCVVELEDGRVLLKRLRLSGNNDGTFNLESSNAPTIKNVKVLKASPVLGVVYR